jgi:hypothetical protein
VIDNWRGVCRFCGWEREVRMADEKARPTFFDMTEDEVRDVTQADVDAWIAIEQAYGALRRHVDAEHERLRQKLTVIRSKAGLPHIG